MANGVRQTSSGVVQTSGGVAQTVLSSVTVIDDFERDSLGSEYNLPGGVFSIASNVVFNGSNSLEANGATSGDLAYSTSDHDESFAKGETAVCYMRFDNTNARGAFVFGIDPNDAQNNHYRIEMRPGADTVRLDKTTNGSFTGLTGDFGYTISTGTWYKITDDWQDGTDGGTDNNIAITVEEEGASNSTSFSAEDSDHSGQTNFGWRNNNQTSGETTFYDWAHHPA